MIAILKKDGQYRPVVVCDHCGDLIDDALGAMEFASSAPEGATAQAFYVHKGAWEQAISVRLGGMHGSEQLAVHLLDLVRGALSKSDRQHVRNLLSWSEQQE